MNSVFGGIADDAIADRQPIRAVGANAMKPPADLHPVDGKVVMLDVERRAVGWGLEDRPGRALQGDPGVSGLQIFVVRSRSDMDGMRAAQTGNRAQCMFQAGPRERRILCLQSGSLIGSGCLIDVEVERQSVGGPMQQRDEHDKCKPSPWSGRALSWPADGAGFYFLPIPHFDEISA